MARRILVVEDEAPIREMVSFVLAQNGFHPVEAEDYFAARSTVTPVAYAARHGYGQL